MRTNCVERDAKFTVGRGGQRAGFYVYVMMTDSCQLNCYTISVRGPMPGGRALGRHGRPEAIGDCDSVTRNEFVGCHLAASTMCIRFGPNRRLSGAIRCRSGSKS